MSTKTEKGTGCSMNTGNRRVTGCWNGYKKIEFVQENKKNT